MTDTQLKLLIEKLSAIEATLVEHQKSITKLYNIISNGLEADLDNRKLIQVVEGLQKQILSLIDEKIA